MSNWITGICQVNGINIHYLRTGGDKPPGVLLHGLMTSGVCWTPVARALESNYDVIMPDARGHGNSSAPRVVIPMTVLLQISWVLSKH